MLRIRLTLAYSNDELISDSFMFDTGLRKTLLLTLQTTLVLHVQQMRHKNRCIDKKTMHRFSNEKSMHRCKNRCIGTKIDAITVDLCRLKNRYNGWDR